MLYSVNFKNEHMLHNRLFETDRLRQAIGKSKFWIAAGESQPLKHNPISTFRESGRQRTLYCLPSQLQLHCWVCLTFSLTVFSLENLSIILASPDITWFFFFFDSNSQIKSLSNSSRDRSWHNKSNQGHNWKEHKSEPFWGKESSFTDHLERCIYFFSCSALVSIWSNTTYLLATITFFIFHSIFWKHRQIDIVLIFLHNYQLTEQKFSKYILKLQACNYHTIYFMFILAYTKKLHWPVYCSPLYSLIAPGGFKLGQ